MICQGCGEDRIPDFVDRKLCRRCLARVPVELQAAARRALVRIGAELSRRERTERARARAAESAWGS